ncbi:MAG: DUF1592 domain-containing protein, partial [Myxococcota bacterium]
SSSERLDDEDCVRRTLATFAERAWRRQLKTATTSTATSTPMNEADTLFERWQALVEAGESHEAALRLVLRHILTSPSFFFRNVQTNRPQVALASRLSFFLWGSVPDDELLNAAYSGDLDSDAELRRQVRRLLNDPRSQRLIDGFGRQWLSTKKAKNIILNPQRFPDAADDALLASIGQESEVFLQQFLRSDRSILTLLDADFSVVNERLSRHYGTGDIQGDAFQVVSATVGRSRITELSAWLVAESDGTDPSPIKRGQWISDHLICDPVPPPPAGLDIGELSSDPSLSTREKLERHRSDPLCAGCHTRLDIIGMGFQLHDASGRRIDDPSIDSLGQFPSGAEFVGGDQAASAIEETEFVSCMLEWLYRYGAGRAPDRTEKNILATLTERAIGTRATLKELIEALVMTPAFRQTKTDE